MTTLIIIYAVGVLINALVAASIYDDLKEDKVLEKVRLAALVFFVIASFATWVYALCYVIVKLIKAMFKSKPKEDAKSND